MSDWSEIYRYGLCRPQELSELQQFLHRYWKAAHPLAVHRSLMDWQHLDVKSGCYHFIIARHIASNDIHAVLGFIPVSQFDAEQQPYRDIWLAIWKSREDVHAPGLGLSLLFYLLRRYKPRSLSAIGISPIARSIYSLLGYKLGTLNHYYMLHPAKTRFQLVSGQQPGASRFHSTLFRSDKRFIHCSIDQFKQLITGKAASSLRQPNRIPSKSPSYWLKRYFGHPVYTYETFAIRSESDPDTLAFITLRRAVHAGASALRIVDYIGEWSLLENTRACFEQLLIQYDAEYIDFYLFGIPEITLTSAGFMLNSPDSPYIVPNYFEPFEQRNIRIDFAYKAGKHDDYFITKGDSDQDRPNLIVR